MRFSLLFFLLFTSHSFAKPVCTDWLLIAQYEEEDAFNAKVRIEKMKQELKILLSWDRHMGEETKVSQNQHIDKFTQMIAPFQSQVLEIETEAKTYKDLAEVDSSCEKLDYLHFASRQRNRARYNEERATITEELVVAEKTKKSGDHNLNHPIAVEYNKDRVEYFENQIKVLKGNARRHTARARILERKAKNKENLLKDQS